MKFDMHKNDWHIKIENYEQFIVIREWLYSIGLMSMYSPDWSLGITQIDYRASDEAWIRLFKGEESNYPEIKVQFATSIKYIEFPETKSESEKQLDTVMAKLAELQKEAEQLQETIKKEKK